MTRRPLSESARDHIGPGGALGLMVLALALLILVGGTLVGWGLWGLVLAQLSCFALPAYLTAHLTGDTRRVLGITWPGWRAVAGALLVGCSFWWLDAAFLGQLSQRWMSPTEAKELTGPILGQDPLALRLVVLALVPAVCEELLVRGAIARGLRPALGLVGAALVSAAYFALLHGSLARALPVGVLGVVLALAALRTGSTATSAIIHGCNNALVVVTAQPALAGWAALLSDHRGPSLATAGVLTAAGSLLLWRKTPGSPS